jgi:hypothetical protein
MLSGWQDGQPRFSRSREYPLCVAQPDRRALKQLQRIIPLWQFNRCLLRGATVSQPWHFPHRQISDLYSIATFLICHAVFLYAQGSAATAARV